MNEKMKQKMQALKFAVAGAVLVAGAFAPAAMAQTPTIIGTVDLYAGTWGGEFATATATPYQYGVGGEFTAVTSGVNFNQYYSSSALYTFNPNTPNAVTGFETFCVQTGVNFTPYNWGGPAYSISLSPASIGNYNGDGDAHPQSNPADNYPLSAGTAWLYAEFATGNLSDYNYANSANTTLGSRLTDAGLLQEAIWALQGGQYYFGYGFNDSLSTVQTSDRYYLDAVSALGGDSNANAPAPSDYDGVEILNLWDSGNNPAQNQLVYTGGFTPPVTPGNNERTPDSGAPLALLALSLAGLAVFARRMEPSSQLLRK